MGAAAIASHDPPPARVVYLDGIESPGAKAAYQGFAAAARRRFSVTHIGLALERHVCGTTERAALAQCITSVVSAKTPDLIVLSNAGLALAARELTVPSPILFTVAADPLQIGLVPSLADATPRFTGVSSYTNLGAKPIEALRRAFPKTRKVAVLADAEWQATGDFALIQRGCVALGVRCVQWTLTVPWPDKLGEQLASQVDAVFVPLSFSYYLHAPKLVERLAQSALPVVYANRTGVDLGGTLAYHADPLDVAEQLAEYAVVMVRPPLPGRLPVLRPSRVQVVLSLTHLPPTQPRPARRVIAAMSMGHAVARK